MPMSDSHWRAMLPLALCACGSPALAQAQAAASTAPAELAESAPAENESGQAARIFIGPQYVSGTAISLPARSEVAGGAVIASFSSRDPAWPATMRSSMPSGAPVTGRLTSGFGPRYHPIHGGQRYHSGIDVAAPTGSPIRATSDGVISAAGWAGGYGLLVAVNHGAGMETRYAHMSATNVSVGQQVRRGDVIGFVGSTGDSTGPHVHYEVRRNGLAIDPLAR